MNLFTSKKLNKPFIDPIAWALIIFIFLNLLLKFYYLPQESIYGDEAFSIFYAQQSWSELATTFVACNTPPLHMIGLHFWIQVFGISDISTKAFSIILSTLCAIVLFVFSKKFLSKQTAIIVSALFLFSNVQLFYSHEIRTYALVELLCMLSFYYYLKLMKAPDKKGAALLFIINLLLLFSHYLTIYIFITQFVCSWMYYKESKKSIWYYIISQLLIVIIFIPWLKVVFAILPKSGGFWMSAPGFAELKWFTFMLNGNEWLFEIFSFIIICSLILVILNKRFSFFKPNFDVKIYTLFLLWYILPIGLDYCIAQYTPVFLGRYILYATLGLFLLIAYIISNLNSSPIAILVSVFLLWNLIAVFDMKPEKEDDWKSIVPKIKAMQDKKTLVYISSSYKYKEFSFYYDRAAFQDYNNTIPRLFKQNVLCLNSELEKVDLDTINQVLFVQSHSQFEDPDGLIKKKLLKNNFKICKDYQVKCMSVTIFKRDSLPCSTLRIVETKKPIGCDLWESNAAINEQPGDTVMIYKTSMEPNSNCLQLPASVVKEKTRSGNYSGKINKQNQYSIGLFKSLKEIKDRREINLSAFVNYEVGSDIRLVISVEKKDAVLFRRELKISEQHLQPNEWHEITFSAIIPKGLPDNAELKIYFWNPAETSAFIDDVAVQLQTTF
jgi:hypothetical protein